MSHRLATQLIFFFFNDTATTEIYTLSLHDALPILRAVREVTGGAPLTGCSAEGTINGDNADESHYSVVVTAISSRSEEHTSELQSRQYLVCRLLLEKKKKTTHRWPTAV